MFTVLEHYLKILQNENLKAATNKSHFFLTRVKFLGHNIERKTIYYVLKKLQKLQPCYSKTSTTNKQKENPRIPWNVKFLKQIRL